MPKLGSLGKIRLIEIFQDTETIYRVYRVATFGTGHIKGIASENFLDTDLYSERIEALKIFDTHRSR